MDEASGRHVHAEDVGVAEDDQGGRFLEAKSEQRRGLSKDKCQDTLMPVRPKGRPTNEGLSRDGETAEVEDQDMARDEVAQVDGCVQPDATSQTEEGQEKSESAE